MNFDRQKNVVSIDVAHLKMKQQDRIVEFASRAARAGIDIHVAVAMWNQRCKKVEDCVFLKRNLDGKS